jgi:hypothetical protein
VWNCV